MEKDTGGNAFPTTAVYESEKGMTLRDYFAANALQGMLAHSTRYKPLSGAPENWHDAISQEAFAIADSMIESRK